MNGTFGSPGWIGRLFLTDHLLAFEITSIVLLIAAVGGVILGEHTKRRDVSEAERAGACGPGVVWYVGIAAFLFGIGALGVLVRRNPLIVLLSLELMLNGANLALIAFARSAGNGAGQIFALAVMAVAASEVCVGLGLVVALNRRRLPLDVDELSELRG